MLRISDEHLIEKNGLLYHNNQPYYGYSYHFNDEGIFQSAYKIINGKKVDLLVEEDIAEPGDIIVSSGHLKETGNTDEDEQPIYAFKGQLFEGVAYMFDKEGRLLRLSSFDEGEEHTFITYYLSGMLQAEKMLFEDYEWYENGQLKKKKVRNSKYHILILQLSEHGRIQWVSIKEEYNNLAELELISFDKEVDLSGSNMNDEIFQKLTKKQSYNTIKKLSLNHSKITGPTLFNCMHNGIQELFLQNNYIITQSDIDKIQESFPSCQVTFFPRENN